MPLARTTTCLATRFILMMTTLGTAPASAQFSYEFTDSGQSLPNQASWGVALGDLDGDGDLDAFVTSSTSTPGAGSMVLMNDGSGSLVTTHTEIGLGDENYLVALGDLDGDGDLDAFVGNHGEPDTVYFNDGEGRFTSSGTYYGDATITEALELGDVDGDGDLDAVTCGWGGELGKVWLNEGNGTFADSGQTLVPDGSCMDLGDIDGDGDLDLVIGSFFAGTQLWTNDGSGTFTWKETLDLSPSSIQWLAEFGDLDGDGDLDLWVAPGADDHVLTNDGSGAFTLHQTLDAPWSQSLRFGDLDNDGDLDAFVSGNYTEDTVWTNGGDATFGDSGHRLGHSGSARQEVRNAALGDLDADGDLDAYVAHLRAVDQVFMNDADTRLIYNLDAGTWHSTPRSATGAAAANDHLLIMQDCFDTTGIIDVRDKPLEFIAREEVRFGPELLYLAADGSSFIDLDANNPAGYVVEGAFVSPEEGSLIFSSLEIDGDGDFAQNDAQLLIHDTLNTRSGSAYLRGEIYAFGSGVATESAGVNYVSQDTDVYGDYTNEGSTIIQVGTLRIYGDLTNLGTMSGDYSTSRMGGEGPQAGDGLSIAGAYTIGQAASLVMPQPIWRLRVGGDLDIAIDDPSRFAMAQATIELTGQAPGGQQTIETLGESFPVGTLRIAAGADVTVVDDRVNQLEGGGEDLHVDTLVIEAGASLTTAGHRIHVRNLILEGTVDDEGNLIEIEACPADLNGDGSVDGIDLSMVLGAWAEADSDADLDGDDVVGGSDLAIILAAWGQPCEE